MSARLTFDGLVALRSTLHNSGEICADGVRSIVADTAQRFADRVKSEIKPVTGNLSRGIKVKEQRIGANVASYLVVSTARHAHLHEYGFMHKNSGRHVPGKFLLARATEPRRVMNDEIAQRLPDILQVAIDKR